MGMELPRCPECDEVLFHDRHRFENTNSKVISQYCDVHCPRCFKNQGEMTG